MAGPWFDEPADRMAQAVQSQVARLEMSPLESTRRQNLLYDLELYHGQKLSSLYQMNGDGYERIWNPDNLVFNVCYSLVGTIRNRICSFRPRAQFLPNGGDYKADHMARDMTEMSDAWAEEVGYQDEASLSFRDLLTGDGGVYKVWIEGGKVCGGRFPAWEFFFDEGESIYGYPECAYHVRYMPVEQAADSFGIEERKLRSQTISVPNGILYVTNRDLVRVVEAWRRARHNKQGELVPGKHVVVCGTETPTPLEPWPFDGFGLCIGRFDERAVGIWGTGAITPIRSVQVELNELQRTLREAHRKAGSLYIGLQENEAAPSKITNDYVQIVRFLNQAPVFQSPPAVNAEVYEYVELLKKQAYETLGVSQFLASGQKQPGIDAAVAIRESSELQTDRLALLSQRWEDMRVDASGWWWRMTKELAKRGMQPKWRAVSRGAWREIVFGDMEAEFEIRRFPSSLFGQTIAAKLQRATELTQAGFMSKEDALKGLDIPDLSPLIDLNLAPSYAMQTVVDDILNDGVYTTPDPYIDPVAMQAYARNRYLLALSKKMNYPPERMAMMRRLIDAMDAPIAAAKAKAMPPAPPPGPGAIVPPPQPGMPPAPAPPLPALPPGGLASVAA